MWLSPFVLFTPHNKRQTPLQQYTQINQKQLVAYDTATGPDSTSGKSFGWNTQEAKQDRVDRLNV